jgi:hypothetical protein
MFTLFLNLQDQFHCRYCLALMLLQKLLVVLQVAMNCILANGKAAKFRAELLRREHGLKGMSCCTEVTSHFAVSLIYVSNGLIHR